MPGSLTVLALSTTLLGFQGTHPDSVADSLRAARLADLTVTVTRESDRLSRLPMAAGVVSREALRAGQPTLGLDEALSTIPGVYVANRWNYSLDQRLSIRGFGSRANFGLRGVKVLLDGVPQTLPDGQSQLTNIEFGALERVEVLRGMASALYGNASGGVVAFQTEAPPADGLRVDVRGELGSFATAKGVLRASARRGAAHGSMMVSRMDTDGFRRHGAARQRQAALSFGWDLSPATSLLARWGYADAPEAKNPGALTVAEAAADPSQPVATNVSRGADKAVTQHQASLQLRSVTSFDWTIEAAVFGIWRDLDNPLATPPPGPPSATAGTFNAIDRAARGARAQAGIPLPLRSARLVAGLDYQRMEDDRTNRVSDGGEPTEQILADQRELTTEFGPFAQVHWDPVPRLTLQGGLRYDRVRFEVQDRHLADGEDASGARTMAEWSGNLGASVELVSRVRAYGSVATAFETPTSTELVTTTTGTVGLNAALGPQRSTGVELGLRAAGTWWSVTAAGFSNRIRDAIIQAREQAGRAFFANAGKLRNEGFELGVSAVPSSRVSITGAYTFARYRFDEYRLVNGAEVDTLDGNQLAGVPRHFLRAGLRIEPRPELVLYLDQLLSSSLYADDANRIEVPGWGAGVTDLRATWTVSTGRSRLTPFLAVRNLFDRRYVGSVTINGFGGRVLEPSPGRHAYVGLSWRWQ